MHSIALIRHGRPALSRNVRLTAREYRDWWARYDASGLRAGHAPAAHVGALVEGARVVSSPLPRARESARLARGGAEPDRVLAELVEAPLPPPPLGPLRLRPLTWGTISRLLWMAGHSSDGESAREAARRAARAADALEAMAMEAPVAVFAHGWFNRMVGRELRRRGWRCARGRGDGYWSFRVYEKT